MDPWTLMMAGGQGRGRGRGKGRGQGKGHAGGGRGHGMGCGPECSDPHHHHGGFPNWFRNFMGKQPRAERGEVKFMILAAVKETPRHGYEIIQYIQDQSGGAYRPSAGTVYPTLQMLEEMDLVESEEKEGRKRYRITDEGREELSGHEEDVEDAYARMGRQGGAEGVPDFARFADKMHRLGRTMRRAFRRGKLDSGQFDEIMKVLEDAAKRIQRIVKTGGRKE